MKQSKTNKAIDIVKLIMAFLVVAIHTEPFGAWFILDKGFGIITRLCVPFFFVASSYFFFRQNGDPIHYLKRLFLLYLIWSVIYLPFDLQELREMAPVKILTKYFWTGNGHALWYLCGSMVGFLVTYGLSRIMRPCAVFLVAVVFLLAGCMKSTYAPIWEACFAWTIPDVLGSRNGLFYAFAYYAMGLVIAQKDDIRSKPEKKHIVGFLISFAGLVLESAVLVLVFETPKTILWVSVLPLTYNFFMIVKRIQVPITDRTSYILRKSSTLIYVSHCFIMYLLPTLRYWQLFFAVSALSVAFSLLIIVLGKHRGFRWLRFIS